MSIDEKPKNLVPEENVNEKVSSLETIKTRERPAGTGTDVPRFVF